MGLDGLPLEAVDRAIRRVIQGRDGRGTKQAYLPSVPELCALAEREIEAINAERRRERKAPLPGHWGYPDHIASSAITVGLKMSDVDTQARRIAALYPAQPLAEVEQELREAADAYLIRRGGKPRFAVRQKPMSAESYAALMQQAAHLTNPALRRSMEGWLTASREAAAAEEARR